MNSKLIASAVVAIAAMGSVSAFAQSQNHLYGEAALVFAPVASSSTVTRAEVTGQYLQARQAGALPVSQEAAFAVAPAEPTTLTRTAVREEARHYVILDGSNRKIYR
ncbi:MAG: DUF4148 domain-containing protein [Pseudomonadota bacterium]